MAIYFTNSVFSFTFLFSPEIQFSEQRPEPVRLVTEWGQRGSAHSRRRGLFTRLLSTTAHRPADHQGLGSLNTQKQKENEHYYYSLN